MQIRRWIASAAARRHMLSKHGVTWDEVDEVMESTPQLRRGRKVRGEQRYYVEGRTHAGRALTVVFRVRGDAASIVTAYEGW